MKEKRYKYLYSIPQELHENLKLIAFKANTPKSKVLNAALKVFILVLTKNGELPLEEGILQATMFGESMEEVFRNLRKELEVNNNDNQMDKGQATREM